MKQPFRIDFSINRGHEMIVDRKDGIRRDELDELELQMLQSGKIPHLLPVEWLEIDGVVSFRYLLSGRKMLLHRLQVQPLSMEQFYTLLLGIVEAFEECKHYMLRPEGCLLDDHYLFVGEQLNDIAVAYVPLKASQTDEASVTGDLLSLVVRWTSYIQDIDGAGLQRILQPLNASKWPLTELRTIVLGLIGETLIHTDSKHASEQMSIFQNTFSGRGAELREELREEKISDEQAVPISQEIPYVELREKQDMDLSRKRLWLVSALIAIAIACAWKYLYLSTYTSSGLYISLGLSLMGLATIYLVWARQHPAGLLSKGEDSSEKEEFIPVSQPLGKCPPYEHALNEVLAEPKAYNRTVKVSDRPESYLYSNAGHTVDLRSYSASAGVTALLTEESVESSKAEETSLYREWAGGGCWIGAVNQRFTIGRLGEQVSYEEEAQGISRLHLELERDGGEYRAKDLGSRNGSTLNGESMIPYKSYSFAEGDIIQLAGSNGPKYELKKM